MGALNDILGMKLPTTPPPNPYAPAPQEKAFVAPQQAQQPPGR